MNKDAFIEWLAGYFSAKYSRVQLEEYDKYVTGITPASLLKMKDWMKRNISPSKKVGVIDLRAAFQEVGEREKAKTSERPDYQRVTCDVCGNSYQWNIAADDDCWFQHDVSAGCPRCGFFHADTLSAAHYTTHAGAVACYERDKARASAELAKRGGKPCKSRAEMQAGMDKLKREVEAIKTKVYEESRERMKISVDSTAQP